MPTVADKLSASNRISALLVRAGNLLCALPVPGVIETMRCPPVTAISGTCEFVIGVAVIRGETAPVVDLGTLLGSSAERSNRARLVTVQVGRRLVGLAVDAVLGLREFEPSSFNKVPPLLRQAHPEVLKAVVALDRELMVVLDGSRILTEEILEQLPNRR